MIITLKGRVPSKKNSKRVFIRNGSPVVLPSEAHQAWHTEQMWLLKKHKPKTPIEKCEICLSFWFPDNRKADLSNKAESILDLLVDAEIIFDDSWQFVETLLLYSEGLDVKNPRVLCEISEL